MALLNKYDLANYIRTKYSKDYGEHITDIKLHKALYFLFAYYGAEKLGKYLFDANFIAEHYGPIEKDIENSKEAECNDIPEKEFIDDLLNRVFRTSEFVLIDTSQDKCWLSAYEGDKKMSNDEIVEEYVNE